MPPEEERKGTRTFHRGIQKMKRAGKRDIYFYTIPSGFSGNEELIGYWQEQGYQAEITDGEDGYGILHLSW